jgi:hypothetical protein
LTAFTCHYCGNGPPGLAVIDERVSHAWKPDTDDEEIFEFPDCPPVAKGSAVCSYCQGAFSIDDLEPWERVQTVQWDLNDPIKGDFVFRGKYDKPDRPLTDEPQEGEPDRLGLGQWIVRDQYKGDGPILRCRDAGRCERELRHHDTVQERRWIAADEKVKAAKAAAASAKPDKSAKPEDLLSLVPSSGPGVAMVDMPELLDVPLTTAKVLVKSWVAGGELRFELVRTARGGKPKRLYWAASESAEDEDEDDD